MITETFHVNYVELKDDPKGRQLLCKIGLLCTLFSYHPNQCACLMVVLGSMMRK